MSYITPTTVNSDRISLGGGCLYLSPTVVINKDSLPTNYRNVGLIDKDNTFEMNLSNSIQFWRGGTPSRDVGQFIIGQELSVKTSLSEIDHQTLAWATGETLIYTRGTGTSYVNNGVSQTTTLVKGGVGGSYNPNHFSSGQILEVVVGSVSEYRWVKIFTPDSLVPSWLLGEPLSRVPDNLANIYEITKAELFLGLNLTPTPLSLKYVKKLPGLGQVLNIVLFKVIPDGQLKLNFQDDAKNVIPLSFKALSDGAVHNGALGYS